MSLSLTCACGARLEIDAKFAGQTINCPDCNRPLKATPPARPPALTSLWAVSSFVTALVGAFTVVGTLAAMGLGFVALGKIARSPEPMGGRRFALAGIALGGVFTALTAFGLLTTELFGLEGLLRALEYAGKIEYRAELTDVIDHGDQDTLNASIQRPTRQWGKLLFSKNNARAGESDELVLINVWEDAHVFCLAKDLGDRSETLEACRAAGQERFLQSELVANLLGRRPGAALPTGSDRDRKSLPGDVEEFMLDMRLAGRDRTYLIHVHKGRTRIMVVAGGTRKTRYSRLEPQIRKAVESFKMDR